MRCAWSAFCHRMLPALTPGYMSAARPLLLLIGPETSSLARFVARAVPGLPVRHCLTVREGAQQVSKERVRVLACEAKDASGASTAPFVETVAAHYATIGLIGVVRRAAIDVSALVGLVRAGAHALLMVHDRLTTLECSQVVTDAIVRSGISSARPRLLGAVPTSVRPLLDYGLKYANGRTSVTEAARALNVHRKTLFWWCAEANLPAPQQLLGWCRLLAAASLLDDAGRRVDHIALELDFPSGTALRNLLQRYCGCSPGELRALGASAEIERQFRKRLGSVDLRA